MPDTLPDLTPLTLPEFAALVERHQAGGDIAHVVADWLRDRGLDVVADNWLMLVRDGKGHRLADYVAGIVARRGDSVGEMIYHTPGG